MAAGFIRGARTAMRMTRIPAAWNTASNACVKLASRSSRTNFARPPGILQVHGRVPGLLDDPGLDRVLRCVQDPDYYGMEGLKKCVAAREWWRSPLA
jgi:hypothetical protein